MDGSATFATERFRFATAATRIRLTRTTGAGVASRVSGPAGVVVGRTRSLLITRAAIGSGGGGFCAGWGALVGDGSRCDLFAADALAEDVIRPALVEQDEWHADRGHDRHD